ncbi:GAP family protein [Nonomuraea sp. NPDC050328]|uniref:GAP family protein n=1 Tax=Nonomuraea sp. NPDC050328 TaxID=3364361 RepID=UPI00378FFE60
MNVTGELLPLALGVAISPVPIIAVILMLLAPRAGGTSTGFLIGWVAGVVIATVLFAMLAEAVGLESGGQPSAVVSWIKLLLGVVMLLLAIKQWKARPKEGQAPKLPAWMAAIDKMTPGRSESIGFLLSAVNPKNLAMCVAAGVAIAQGGSYVLPLVVFTVIAVSTVAVPVIAYAVAAERMRGPLNSLRHWLEHNNATALSSCCSCWAWCWSARVLEDCDGAA